MFRLIVVIALMVVALVVAAAQAQDKPAGPPTRLDPVVITATKVETPAERLGASVTVITEEELREANLTRVEDALRNVPGVEVLRQGGPGKLTTVRIRGSSAAQTQVMVDGMRVKSPTSGQFDFADLVLDGIERIEIVRGPQSTLHGADAIGGVINVITKKGAGKPSGFASTEVGSYSTFREAVGTSGAIGPFNFSLSGSKFDTRGQERTFRNDDSDQRSVAARLGVDFPWKGELSLSGRYAKTYIDVPFQGFAPFPREPDSQNVSEFFLYNLRYDQAVMPWWRIAARAGQMWNNVDNFDGPLPPVNFVRASAIDIRRREFELLSTWDTGKINSITLGLEHGNERGKNETQNFAPPDSQFRGETNTRSLFLQDELRLFERVILGGGVRFEDNDAFGGEWTPRLSIAILVPETGSKLRGAWAKGFRAPTFNDLFFPPGFGCPGFGNPNVQPEHSKSWEAGVDQRVWENRVRLGATYFRNDFRNLITGVPSAVPFCQEAGNVGRARTDGLEFSTEVDPLAWVTVWTNYTYLDTENETTRAPLSLHPHHRWNAGVRVTPLPRVTLFAQAHVVSSQLDVSVGRHIPGYYRVEAGGTVRVLDRLGIMEKLDFTARVQNLTDEDYQEPAGYRAQGFAATFGLKAYFR